MKRDGAIFLAWLAMLAAMFSLLTSILMGVFVTSRLRLIDEMTPEALKVIREVNENLRKLNNGTH